MARVSGAGGRGGRLRALRARLVAHYRTRYRIKSNEGWAVPLDRGRRGARVDDATEATEPKGYRGQKRTPRFGIATWRTLFQLSSLSILLD